MGCWAGILAQLPPEFPLNTGVDGRADVAAFCFSRSAALTPMTAFATAASTNSGSLAPGRERTSSMGCYDLEAQLELSNGQLVHLPRQYERRYEERVREFISWVRWELEA